MTTTRRCRAPRCLNTAAHHKLLCCIHIYRWRCYRDFDHNEWTTADTTGITEAAQARRLPTQMTRVERQLLGLTLTDLGLPASEIARITRVSPRTVTRWRSNRTKITSRLAA